LFNKNLLDRELERKHIQDTNITVGMCLLGISLIGIAIINPIAFILGILLSKKNKSIGILASIILVCTGFLVSVVCVIVTKVSILSQFINFFVNYYNVFTGKSIFDFIREYIINPFNIIFFALAMLAGIIAAFYFMTDSKEQQARKESRKRFKDDKEVSFFEGVSIQDLKKHIPKKYIKELTHVEVEGTILGKSKLEDVFITDIEAAAHGMIVGTTGAGKTTVILKFVDSCAQRYIPLFFVDGKGDHELPEKVKKIAKRYGRKFYHFDIKGEQSRLCYNPLLLGNTDNTKEKLIDTTDWSEPHYKSAAERVLLVITNVVNQILKETESMNEDEVRDYFKLKRGESLPRIKKDIICLQDMLTPSVLEQSIRSVKDNDLKNKWIKIYNKLNPDWYMGLEQRLALIAESSVGELVKETKDGIRLTDIMEKKAIILFSLNALENRNVTEMMGRLIVKDINTVISLKRNKDVVYSIFDEHGAYISEDIESQFAMARSFGLRTITSTQNISDYKKSKLGDVLMHKIVGNTNFKIIMKQNETENAEYLAKTIGTHKNIDRTMSTDYEGRFKGLGMKQIEEFIVNPNDIKALGTGEAVIIKKIPKQEIIKDVKIDYIDFNDKEFLVEEKINNEFIESKIKTEPEREKRYDPLSKKKRRSEDGLLSENGTEKLEDKKEKMGTETRKKILPNMESIKRYDPLARRKRRKNLDK